MPEEEKLNVPSNISPLNSGDEEEYDDFLSDFDIAKLLVVGSKSIFWVILIIALCLLGSFLYNRYTKPVYESTSILKLEPKSDAATLGLKNFSNPQENKISTLSGEIELIKSRIIYEKVISKMNLAVSYYANGKVLYEERYKNSPFEVTYTITNPAFFDFRFDIRFLSDKQFSLSYMLGEKEVVSTHVFGEIISNKDFTFIIKPTRFFDITTPDYTYFFTFNSKPYLEQYLIRNINVEIENLDAFTIKISFKDHDRLKAADIVNNIDSVYLIQTVEAKSKTQEQTIRFLEETLENTEANLTMAEGQLESFTRKNKTIDVKGDFFKVGSKIELLDNEKIELQVQLNTLNQLSEMIISNGDINLYIPALSQLPDQQLATAIGSLNTLKQERTRILSSQKENTFVIRTMDQELNTQKNSVLDLIVRNKKSIQDQLGQVGTKESELEGSFHQLPTKETEYTRLKRFYNIYEKYYLLLMEKKAEYGIAKAGTIPNFIILSPASNNFTPIYPNTFFLYLTGGGIGIFLGVLLIFFRYFLHNTISTQRELEKSVRATFLGGVPEYVKEKMEVSRLIVDKNPKSAISEALRSIRTNLEFICPNKKKKLIAVTSTVSGEGKTFVAVNLGGVIALSNQKVILLDLDMRKPKVHLAFERENFKGMSTILIGKHSIEECICESSIENLNYIPAGPTPPNPSELILRPEFDLLLETLFKKYDVIIIDTPPVGLVTDGVLILKKADVPIYVVRANYSKKGVKRNINKLVKSAGFTRLTVIMNALRSINTYGYGGYGYGYGYGYYDGDHKKGFLQRIKARLGENRYNKE